MDQLKVSPLDAQHRALGAKMAAFAGWEMPLSYGGTVGEHTAVRTDAGVFDVSHLGKILVRGSKAAEVLDRALTNSIAPMPLLSARYTLLLDDHAGIVDDMIVYAIAEQEYLVVPNAANVDDIEQRIRNVSDESVSIEQTDDAILALQGPRSREVLEKVLPGAPAIDYMHIAVSGADGWVARSGYTGEHGYEIICSASAAPDIWKAIADAGVTPCGLAARDTLRLEMGYPLHGNDIDRSTRPDEAGLLWAVAKSKSDFEGKHALESGTPTKKLIGIVMKDRVIPRHGCAVFAPDEESLGVVTSGTFSPTRKAGIALAYVKPSSVVPGDDVVVDVRGKRGIGVVTKPPFVSSSPKD